MTKKPGSNCVGAIEAGPQRVCFTFASSTDSYLLGVSLAGFLKGLAENTFSIQGVSISRRTVNADHIFSLTWKQPCIEFPISGDSIDSPEVFLSSTALTQAFPHFFALDASLKIIRTGSSLPKTCCGNSVAQYFVLKNPAEASFDNFSSVRFSAFGSQCHECSNMMSYWFIVVINQARDNLYSCYQTLSNRLWFRTSAPDRSHHFLPPKSTCVLLGPISRLNFIARWE